MKRDNHAPVVSVDVYDVTLSWVVENVSLVSLDDFEEYQACDDGTRSPFGREIPYFYGSPLVDPRTLGVYLVVCGSVAFGRVESLEVVTVYRTFERALEHARYLLESWDMALELHDRKESRGQLDVGRYALYDYEIWRVVDDGSIVARDCRSFHADIVFHSGERVGIDFYEPSTFEWLKCVAASLRSVRVTELTYKLLRSGKEIGHRFVVYCSPSFLPRELED